MIETPAHITSKCKTGSFHLYNTHTYSTGHGSLPIAQQEARLAAMQGQPPPQSLPGMAAGAPSSSGPAPPPRPPAPLRPTLARFRTDGYAGYSVAYSPFFPGLLAIASSANFGLVGNGRLHTFTMGQAPSPGVQNKRCVKTIFLDSSATS